MLLIAIDAGGTRTRAVVLTDAGICRGIGLAGRGNPVGVGEEEASTSILAALRGAGRAADCELTEIAAVTHAGAGGNNFSNEFVPNVVAAAGLTGAYQLRGDLAALFCSGTAQGAGYALVAGTGATAVRIEGRTESHINDGMGWLLGDTGSGFWIGHQVARSVALALDGRLETSMVEPVLASYGITQDATWTRGRPTATLALLRAVYDESPLAVAKLASIAFRDPDDPVSCRIVEAAAEGLTRSLAGVHDQTVTGPLVLGGGVIHAQPRLREATMGSLQALGIDLETIDAADGLIGAAVLALDGIGVTITDEVHSRLRDSAQTCPVLRA